MSKFRPGQELAATAAFPRPAAELTAAAARRLQRASPAQRQLILRNSSLTRRLEVVTTLLEESRQLASRDPQGALSSAQAAVAASMALGARPPAKEVVFDLRAEAWSLVANAQRVSGAYAAAERAFKTAARMLRQGSGNALLRGQVLDRQASLRRDQGRFGEAGELLSTAAGLFRELGQSQLLGRAGVKLGSVRYFESRVEEAIRVTLDAGRCLEPATQPELVLGALHNLILFYAEAGDYEVALEVLEMCEPLYLVYAPPLFHLRALWLGARLLVALERWEGAEKGFEAVRLDLVARGLAYDASLASLDLAVVQLQLGRPERVQQLALEMLPVFVAHDIPREASAALLLFARAARDRALSAESVERLLADLKGKLAPHGRETAGRFLT